MHCSLPQMKLLPVSGLKDSSIDRVEAMKIMLSRWTVSVVHCSDDPLIGRNRATQVAHAHSSAAGLLDSDRGAQRTGRPGGRNHRARIREPATAGEDAERMAAGLWMCSSRLGGVRDETYVRSLGPVRRPPTPSARTACMRSGLAADRDMRRARNGFASWFGR